jgi:hypothetical protein
MRSLWRGRTPLPLGTRTYNRAMRSRLRLALAACLFGAASAHAQTAPVAPAAPPGSEPAVRRSVIEDDNARIEELRVRGAVRSIKVRPKGAIKAEYEIVPIDAGRDNADGPHSAKGAAGQRVWRVLDF